MQTTNPTGRPHRNQGLFSDHYLNVTLPGRPDWRALAGEAGATMAEVSRVLDAYAPSQNEAQTEEDLVRPVLRLLGHEGTYEVQPALATPEDPKRPDYVFYRDAASRDANKDRRLTDELLAGGSFAVGDAKFWERPLDASLKGKGRDVFSKRQRFGVQNRARCHDTLRRRRELQPPTAAGPWQLWRSTASRCAPRTERRPPNWRWRNLSTTSKTNS